MGLFVDHETTRWWHMATIQVAENAPALAEILADLDWGFRLDPARASPPGYHWLELYVDARRGTHRCALIAHRLLSALKSISDAGDLPGFRLIAGERWLDYPEASISPNTVADLEKGSFEQHRHKKY